MPPLKKTKEEIEKMDAEVMSLFYEWIKINFGATMVQDSTELREIIEKYIPSSYHLGYNTALDEVGGKVCGMEKSNPIVEKTSETVYNTALSDVRQILSDMKSKQ